MYCIFNPLLCILLPGKSLLRTNSFSLSPSLRSMPIFECAVIAAQFVFIYLCKMVVGTTYTCSLHVPWKFIRFLCAIWFFFVLQKCKMNCFPAGNGQMLQHTHEKKQGYHPLPSYLRSLYNKINNMSL